METSLRLGPVREWRRLYGRHRQEHCGLNPLSSEGPREPLVEARSQFSQPATSTLKKRIIVVDAKRVCSGALVRPTQAPFHRGFCHDALHVQYAM
jgi:hypothetical protein